MGYNYKNRNEVPEEYRWDLTKLWIISGVIKEVFSPSSENKADASWNILSYLSFPKSVAKIVK